MSSLSLQRRKKERMTDTSAMTAQQRDVIFEDMDKVTQKAAAAGVKKLQAGFQVAVLIQYDLGEIVNSVYEAEHLNETERKNEIKKLASYWNQPSLNSSTLYDLRNVSAAFDREFVKLQVEERLASGAYLTWSHFKELQKVKSESKQLAILKKVRQHSWSANELALELQGRKEAAVKRAGGRKPTLPKTPNAMVQKLFTTVQQADNYVTAIVEPLGGLLEMSSSDFDDQFIENVTNTLTRISETTQHFSETEKQLKKVLKRAKRVLEEAGESTTTDDSDFEEEAAPVETPKRRGRPKAETSSIAVSAKADKSESGVQRKKRGRPRRAAQVEVQVVDESDDEYESDE